MTDVKKYDHLFKVLLLGETSVGKTCILLRYTDNEFNETQIITLGVDLKKKNLVIDDSRIVLQLWDTAGQDRFAEVTKQFFRGAQAIVLVYSIDNRGSFEKVIDWIEQIEQLIGMQIVKILVGNKSDRENCREVSFEEGKELAQGNGFEFFECSAMNDVNVNEIFTYAANELYAKAKKKQDEKMKNGYKNNDDSSLRIEKSKKKNSKCC